MKPWVKTRAVNVLRSGGIIAYPTEAVYGLGCDPFDQFAVGRLLELKNRPMEKGLILVAAHWWQVERYCTELTEGQKDTLLHNPKERPVTWLIPDSKNLIPYWIKGKHQQFALRISSHSVVRDLCNAYQGPLISTSANISGDKPIKTKLRILKTLGNQLDYIVPGNLGSSNSPSEIRNIKDGLLIRSAE